MVVYRQPEPSPRFSVRTRLRRLDQALHQQSDGEGYLAGRRTHPVRHRSIVTLKAFTILYYTPAILFCQTGANRLHRRIPHQKRSS